MNPIDEFRKLKSFLPSNEPVPKFGGSDGTDIDKCKEIQVFMVATGYGALIGMEGERRRKIMNSKTTLREARLQFGKELVQDNIKDENDFVFHEHDLDQPISKFSHSCKLNLNFTHGSQCEKIKNWQPSPIGEYSLQRTGDCVTTIVKKYI